MAPIPQKQIRFGPVSVTPDASCICVPTEGYGRCRSNYHCSDATHSDPALFGTVEPAQTKSIPDPVSFVRLKQLLCSIRGRGIAAVVTAVAKCCSLPFLTRNTLQLRRTILTIAMQLTFNLRLQSPISWISIWAILTPRNVSKLR